MTERPGRRLDAITHRGTLVDAVVLVAIFIVSLSIGADVLAEAGIDTLSYTLPVAAMAACGRGLTTPGVVSPEFAAFARRERASTTCAAVIGGVPPLPADLFSMGYRYAIYCVAAAIRIGGLTWTTLDRYVAGLFALSMALTYLLFRMAAGPLLAAFGAGALIFSNHALAMLLDLRDYGKEIWFVMLWLGIAWLLRRGLARTGRVIYLPSAVAGVLLGIGIGFRGDLLVFVPVIVAVIVLALPGWDTRALAVKVVATLAFVAAFLVAGLPILTTLGSGSNLGHVAVLGLAETEAMGVEATAYDFGNLYADGYGVAVTSAYTLVAKHEQNIGDYGTKLYDRQATAMYLDLARHFPADFAARALGATRQILAYPFHPRVEWDTSHSSALNRGLRVHLTARRIQLSRWLYGDELVLAAIAFLVVAVRDIRKAVIATSLVFYFCGYSLIQFHRRHTFHLDIVAIGLVVLIAGAAVSFVYWLARERAKGRSIGDLARQGTRPLVTAIAAGLLLVIGAGVGMWIIRTWQQRHVTSLVDRTLAATWSPLGIAREPLTPFLRARGEPLTEWFQFYVRTRDPQHSGGWWSSATLLKTPLPSAQEIAEAPRAIRASYLQVELGGAACGAGLMRIAVLYSSTTPTIDSDYTRAFYVPVDGAAGLSRLLVPILELPGKSRFEGLVAETDRVDCVRRVLRASPPQDVPLPVLFARLSSDWRSARLYQRLTDEPASITDWGIAVLDNKQ